MAETELPQGRHWRKSQLARQLALAGPRAVAVCHPGVASTACLPGQMLTQHHSVPLLFNAHVYSWPHPSEPGANK